MDMQKYANALYAEGYELGGRICELHKAAQAGDPEAQQILADAEAQAGGMMPGAPMAPMAPEAAPMAPTIPCPSCGNEVTPNPDGTCPVCQFDFNTLAAEAPAGADVPEEAIAERAEEVKQASLNNPQLMNWLINTYHHVAAQ